MSDESSEHAGVRVTDPRMLRAIAHPTRNRILAELTAAGPSRAADLARDLGIPANQASFHLRQLAKYGMVIEAPEVARDKRDRVWKVAAERGYHVNLRAIGEASGGQAAVAVFTDQLRNWAAYLVDRALDETGDDPDAPEHDRRSITDSEIRLTDDERDEFAADMQELFDRWADRTRDRSVPRRSYSYFMIMQPYPPVAPPGRTTGGHSDPDKPVGEPKS
ncbi:helix-turn-helix transcriptional regulator [Microlunatus elymi]|uniref:Helix-turn-helix transcriptional regulator n=1 Tax=Microlunatus elymi TaxID=2596828 RepID=A0A516PX59_9ACTN|nr:helix-turn-helix domain-containing protein [Microlunatus elymi]QDP95541.1 helix-turn-helix transcriptional regulator [Microlunatus elymi]